MIADLDTPAPLERYAARSREGQMEEPKVQVDWARELDAWPPARGAEVTVEMHAVYLAHKHLQRVKDQFTTDAAFDRSFLLTVAAACLANSRLDEAGGLVVRDMPKIALPAHANAHMKQFIGFILASAHQVPIGELMVSRRELINQVQWGTVCGAESATQ